LADLDGVASSGAPAADAAGAQARVDLGAGEAVGDGVIVGVDVDVIVDTDPAHAPLTVFVTLRLIGLFCTLLVCLKLAFAVSSWISHETLMPRTTTA
jgi:hypothetical protein